MSRPNSRRSALLALTTVAAMVGVILRPSPGRTDAPAGRYTIPGDGTVHDTATTLTWQRAANMTGMVWASAGPYCAGLTSPAAADGGYLRSKSSRRCSTILALVRRSSTPSRFRGFPRKALRALATDFGLPPRSWGRRSG